MLKGIPPLVSPDLMHLLMKMGHGDEIVIADGNFPADSKAQQIVRTDGLGVLEVLEAVLKFLPIDKFVDDPITGDETGQRQGSGTADLEELSATARDERRAADRTDADRAVRIL